MTITNIDIKFNFKKKSEILLKSIMVIRDKTHSYN